MRPEPRPHRQRRHSGKHRKRRGEQHDAQPRSAEPPLARDPPQPEEQPFEHDGIFDLQRQPDERERGAALREAARRMGGIVAPRCEQARRADDQQIVEDRSLPTLAFEQIEPQQIRDRRGQCALRPARAIRQSRDQRRGRGDACQRHRLIRPDPERQPERGGGKVEQEQPDRLAVPHIDIGNRAVHDRLRGGVIEFLVDMHDRVAEGQRADEQRDPEQQQPTRNARDGRSERGSGDIRHGCVARSTFGRNEGAAA